MAKKKRRTGWIWFLILLLGAGAFYYFYWMPKANAALNAGPAYSEYTVTRGTVSVTVTGNGLLDAAEETKETVIGGLKIASVEVKEGDAVEVGTVLYTLDPGTVEDRILAVLQDISGYRRTLMRFQDSDAVYAPGAGRVKILYAQKGDLCADVVLKNGCLAVLSADELMGVEIVTAQTLVPGEEVQVTFTHEGRNYTERGTVEALTASGCTVVFPDTTALPGVQATVKKGQTELGTGTVYIHLPMYAYNTAGAVKSVDARLNASVNVGSKLFTLAEGIPSDSYLQAVRDRETATAELVELMHYRTDPVIRAGHAGTVASISLAVNGVTEKDSAVIVLHTGGAVKMTVDIDETDIPGLRLGQHALVTLDAYPDAPFAATVTRLPLIGVQSGSITVYKAELTLEPDGRLLEGMHGSAVITLETHDDIIMIPVAVIEEDAEGAYVLVSDASGPVKRYIRTGISDGTVTEVTDGLNEGDVLLYIPRGGTDMVTKMMTRSPRGRSFGG